MRRRSPPPIRHRRHRRLVAPWIVGALSAVGCSASTSSDPSAAPKTENVERSTQATADQATTITTTAPATVTTPLTRPEWLGQQTLVTGADGYALPVDTPTRLLGRSFATDDTLPPPPSDAFVATISELSGDPLARSSWNETCPVRVDELRYLTVSFWGFDGLVHTGELIVNEAVATDVTTVFATLFADRYPIEEMRIVGSSEIDAPPVGDTNNTSAFVCRVVKGTTTFSEHAKGLAIDINPFHNPYVKGDIILPELARVYADRTIDERAVITNDSVVVRAFADIGWQWGGSWTSLKDYQHFSRNGQ
ncbi:MAG: M15 family metallopeptidase [Acidimicrobiales bacterium]